MNIIKNIYACKILRTSVKRYFIKTFEVAREASGINKHNIRLRATPFLV